MSTNGFEEREPLRLVSTNSLWVAGFQELFGDPCGIDILCVSQAEALGLQGREIVLIDSGSFRRAGALHEILGQFRRSCPELRVIVVGESMGSEADPDVDAVSIERLILSGAKGFLCSSSRPEEFRAALDNVREGSIWAPRRVLTRLFQSARPVEGRIGMAQRLSGNDSHISFTPREAEVLRLLMGGQCNREIGISLGIGPVTVKAHLGRIMRKAGVANRIELTVLAVSGQLSPAETKPHLVVPSHVMEKSVRKDLLKF